MIKIYKLYALLFLLMVNPILAQNEKAESLFQQGLIHNQEGALVEASVLFTQAISEHPDFAQAYYQRGLSFEGMERKEHAIKDYKSAVDAKIQNLQPYFKLITHYKENSMYLAALIITDQIIANMPEQTSGGYYDKGKIYEAMNKPDLAIKAYELSIQSLNDDMPEFKQHLTDQIINLKRGKS